MLNISAKDRPRSEVLTSVVASMDSNDCGLFCRSFIRWYAASSIAISKQGEATQQRMLTGSMDHFIRLGGENILRVVARYFPSTEYLDISHCEVTELAALEKMTNLKVLKIFNNPLSSIEDEIMTAKRLDGKRIALEIREEVAQGVAEFVATGHSAPQLTAILVGEDPASQVYVRNKERACAKAGIASELDRLPASTSPGALLSRIDELNADPSVNGILVQLPLPEPSGDGPALDERAVLDAIDPLKDVDAFSPVNVGRLVQGRPRFLPCTPHGIVQMLHRSGITTSGKHVVVVGRSEIVGKPMAMMLAQKDGSCGPETANATVTIAHSRTQNLQEVCRSADILIAAVGRPEMIRGDMIRPGAVVVDVGINRVGDRLVGDVAFAEAEQVASAITPVPGGVGPLTIAMLMHNTLRAAKLQTQG